MIFPFSFSFSIPGLFNPFSSAQPQSQAHTSTPGSKEQNKSGYNTTRTHQSPTSRTFHAPSGSSQEPGIKDNLSAAAPAYHNPSSSSSSTYPASSSSYPLPLPSTTRRISRSELPKIPRRHHSPSPEHSSSSLRALPLSRKRGWEPTFGAESIQSLASSTGKSSSTTSLNFTSPSGYLDTPAKYREMMAAQEEENVDITMSDDHRYRDVGHDDDAPPPLKKRRGLAGSIVSTAVSAALIGTAVGLTVYRLWRDRGKEGQIANALHNDSDSDQPPPPPYDEAVAVEQPPVVPVTSSAASSVSRARGMPTTPGTPTPRSAAGKGNGRKKVTAHAYGSKRAKARTPRQGYTYSAGGQGVGVGSPRTRTGSEFDFGSGAGYQQQQQEEEEGESQRSGQTEVEDKMDWMGDKLSMLIEQGRRALQAEVVVMSEAREDEVDDGCGGWVEDEEDEADADADADSLKSHARARSGSVRSLRAKGKARPKNIAVPPLASGSGSGSPTKAQMGLGISGVPSSSSYASGSTSLSSSPRRSGMGFAPSSSYAPASTSYSSTHASAGFVPSSSISSSASPFYTASLERVGQGHVRGVSYESAMVFGTPNSSSGAAGAGEEGTWESPEIKASMERARARVLAARRAGGGGV